MRRLGKVGDMRFKLLILATALFMVSGSVLADPPQAFHADSLKSIEAERNGKPFLLILWSLDCAPCYSELEHVKNVRQEGHALDVVLISTDKPDRAGEIEDTLAGFDLSDLESWVFDDPVPERLRYKVDPEWYGELPRAYFYNESHSRTAYSGAISLRELRRMTELDQ